MHQNLGDRRRCFSLNQKADIAARSFLNQRGCQNQMETIQKISDCQVFTIDCTQRVSIYYLLISKIDRDMRPPAKLSYRSAIHKKVVFGSGDAWTLPQIQGEVGGDQEPPGNTWRYPMGSKFFLLILNHI